MRQTVEMDIAVNLVEHYLRMNGYLTLSEYEIQEQTRKGKWETVTDVDMVAIRFPGEFVLTEVHEQGTSRELVIEDKGLMLEPDTVDVIVGEVKQGEAVFNAGLSSHGVLHTVLQRFRWLYTENLDTVISALQETGVHRGRSCQGGDIRTRLVAFGRSEETNINTISLTHIINASTAYLDNFDDIFRGAQFKEPAPAFLHLLNKTGFRVEKTGKG